MLNAIKADFYRLIRSKGFIINQVLLIALLVMTIVTKATGSVGVHVSEKVSELPDQLQKLQWTSPIAVETSTGMASFLIYFCLPLCIMIIGYDLTKHTYKNILTSGLSRGRYLFSKYIVFMFVMAFQFIFYYGVVFLTAMFRTGLGDLTSEFWQKLGSTCLLQYTSLLAIFSIAIVILYLFSSNVGAVITAIVVPVITSVISIFSDWKDIKYLTFQNNIDAAWSFSFSTDAYRITLIVAILISVIFYALTYYVFKKKSL